MVSPGPPQRTPYPITGKVGASVFSSPIRKTEHYFSQHIYYMEMKHGHSFNLCSQVAELKDTVDSQFLNSASRFVLSSSLKF